MFHFLNLYCSFVNEKMLIVHWIKNNRIDFWDVEEKMNSDGTKVDAQQMETALSLDTVKLNNCLRIVADRSVVLCFGNRPSNESESAEDWESENSDDSSVDVWVQQFTS